MPAAQNAMVEAAISLVQERWGSLPVVDDGRSRLIEWGAPYFAPGVGLVTSFHLFDKSTYQGPHDEVVVIPIDRLHEPAAALDELFAALLRLAQRRLTPLLDAPLAQTLGLAPARYSAGMYDHDEPAAQRRVAALAEMTVRFPAVASHMEKIYGLRLPRYLAVFAAFWRSLDEGERRGMGALGRSPGGIMAWFEDGGLERGTRDNLDARLESRFRSDPPELVTVMYGDSDGLHYGLWYDDPADLPTCLAHNYARDSAETWKDRSPSPLSLLAVWAHERLRATDDPAPLSVHAVRAAIEWFAQADTEAVEADPPAARWQNADRIPTLGTFGPALPPGAGSIRVGPPETRQQVWREQPARVKKWIDSARRDCADGRPAAALTFGLDLHWLDAEEYRETARELLVMAYEKLGRHAHAATVRVHYAHRDLGSVAVFEPAPVPTPSFEPTPDTV